MLLFFGVLMGALDISVLGPAIPAIEKTMQLSGTDLSWIFSIYIMFNLFGLPILSKLSDIHGRKVIYIISILTFGVGSFWVSLSENSSMLLVGRAIQGFGSSGIFPVATATIGDVFPVEKRGRALGILGAVFGIAFILGPVIAGTILQFFSWRIIFLINLPIALILIFFAWKLLPGKSIGKKPEINWPGIILLVFTLGGFTIGMNNIEAENFGSSILSLSVFPFFLTALILAPVLVFYDRRQNNSILNIQIFNSTQLRLTALISFGLGLYQSSIIFLPKLSVELFRVTPSQASFMLLPLVIATAIVPPVSGWLLDKIGSRIIVFTGLIVAVVSLFLFSLLSHSMVLFFVAEVCFGIGLAIRVSLKYIVLGEIGMINRATALGMLIIFISVGQLTGAALIGVIISGSAEHSSGFGRAFLLLAVLSAGLVLLSLFLKNRKEEIINE